MMACAVCGVTLRNTRVLFRHNAKGVSAEWRCSEHTTVIIAPEVAEVVDALTAFAKDEGKSEHGS